MNQIYTSLLALKNYPAQASVSDAYDHNLISIPPYDFFKQRVHTIIMEPANEATYCAEGGLAFVNYVGKPISEIHICASIVKSSWMEIAGILLHESWHTNGHKHSFCTEGDDEIPACDPTYESGGSYSINTEFAVKSARNQGLHPALRSQAFATAIENFFQHFNKKPFGITAGSLVKTKDGHLLFHHDKKMETLQISVAAEDQILSSRGSAVVFHPADKLVTALAVRGESQDPRTRENSALKEVLGHDAEPILDVFLDGEVTCVLTAKVSRCRLNGKTTENAIENFKPVQFVMPQQSSLVSPNGTVVSAEDGFLYQIGDKGGWKKSAKQMNIKDTQAVSPKSDLVLLLDGRAGIFDSKKKTWAFPTEFQNLNIDKIVTPYIWSQDLDKL